MQTEAIFFIFLLFAIYILFFKILLIFIVVQVEFSAFPHHPSPLPQASPLPSPVYIPLVIVHVSFIVVPINPSPFSPITPSPLPSGYCQLIPNFNVFGCILLACLFC